MIKKMKNINILFILIMSFTTILQGQEKIINLNLSEIKWVGKEITTKNSLWITKI